MTEQKRKLKKYIVPAMVSNAAFYVLTIVDGIFVGNGVGTDALGAVNLAFPFVMVIGALSSLFAIGGVAVAAVRLGRGDDEGANQAFMHSALANLIVFSILSVFGMLFADKLASLLGADSQTYHQMATDYIFNYSLFLIPAGLYNCFGTFCRNDGNPRLSTLAAIVCTVSNIFGDWLLIYPLQKGVGGAAFATGAAQVFAVIVLLPHYLNRKGKLHFSKFKVQISLFKKIVLRGLPEMISQFAAPVTTFSMNRILTGISDPNVNAYSVISYVGSLFASLMYGLSGGIQPLFGQSYGAKEDDDLKFFLKQGLLIGFVGALAVWGLMFFLGKPACILFDADASAVDIVIKSLPKYCLNFVFATESAILASYLFSTKRTKQAAVLNISRSLLFNSLCINLLPLVFGAEFVWYTTAVAEATCLMIAIVLWKTSERNGVYYH